MSKNDNIMSKKGYLPILEDEIKAINVGNNENSNINMEIIMEIKMHKKNCNCINNILMH